MIDLKITNFGEITRANWVDCNNFPVFLFSKISQLYEL